MTYIMTTICSSEIVFDQKVVHPVVRFKGEVVRAVEEIIIVEIAEVGVAADYYMIEERQP